MSARNRLISLSLAAGLLLSGCGTLRLGVETPTPPLPRVTQSSPTVVPTLPTRLPTATATAGPTSPTRAPATAAGTVTAPAAATSSPASPPTGQPTSDKPTAVPGQPQVTEAILIKNPGSNSSVISPVQVSGDADPTFEQNLVIQVADASGAVMATHPTTTQGVGATRGPFEAQISFTATTEGPGRISVFSTSPRDGGLIHLSSVEVTLLTSGTASINPGLIHNETHIILEPAPQANIAGGRVHVSGFSDYVFESQLALALCGEGGAGAPDPVCGTADNVLSAGTAALQVPDVGQPGPFAGDLTYHVTGPVQARVVVYSRSARDGGIVHLSTVPVKLVP